jgi:hypothetical protein
MKIGDFVDLVARYGSHFVSEKKKHHKVITDFINYVAAQQGVDYGIHMDELEKHKKRDVVPVDVDVMILQSKRLTECQDVIATIYMNLGRHYPMLAGEIENLADKHGGELKRRIDMHKD